MSDETRSDETQVSELTIEVPDGVSLQAELATPAEPAAVAVLCHPHPQYGGSMRGGVIEELFRTLPDRGIAALRFNFRGVERSTGSYGEGVAERADVAAAIAAARAAVADGPLFVAAWSFGSEVSMCVGDGAIDGWMLIAPPCGSLVDAADMVGAVDPRPKRLLVPEHDQFTPPAKAAAKTQGWANSSITTVPGVDHFSVGGPVVVDAAIGLAAELGARLP